MANQDLLTEIAPGRWQLHGPLTFTSIDRFISKIPTIISAKGTTVLDFSHVTQTDSVALVWLLDCAVFAEQQGGSLKWVNLPSQIREIAQISGLYDWLISKIE